MDKNQEFLEERRHAIEIMAKDKELAQIADSFLLKTAEHKYGYNFTWLGRPIIKEPENIVALQEIIWKVKPDLIIETGIAHGGSIIFSASMLELLGGNGKVIGIDIDIREHNKIEIEQHPMMKRIIMLEGSSTAENIVSQVKEIAKGYQRIMVCLDSLHTHKHVVDELNAYADIVSVGSYFVVSDTRIELFPAGLSKDRPWDKGNNPMTAVYEFLKSNDDFIIDEIMDNKLLLSDAVHGYLKRVK